MLTPGDSMRQRLHIFRIRASKPHTSSKKRALRPHSPMPAEASGRFSSLGAFVWWRWAFWAATGCSPAPLTLCPQVPLILAWMGIPISRFHEDERTQSSQVQCCAKVSVEIRKLRRTNQVGFVFCFHGFCFLFLWPRRDYLEQRQCELKSLSHGSQGTACGFWMTVSQACQVAPWLGFRKPC